MTGNSTLHRVQRALPNRPDPVSREQRYALDPTLADRVFDQTLTAFLNTRGNRTPNPASRHLAAGKRRQESRR